MDVKDLSTESTLSEHSNDVSKYTQGGTTIQRNRNNLYQDIGSNSSGKVDAPNARPCAVIGPDRVIPPPNDSYLKKATVEPWPSTDNVYHQRPPEYHKIYQNPSRNISPRQTFQENMQRIMVPPLYKGEDHMPQVPDRNPQVSKNLKINSVASDTKYCDVPYAVNTVNNDPKNIKSVDSSAPSFNQPSRLVGQGWPPGSGSLRHQRQYGPPELYQFPDYQNCVGPRSASSSRPGRPVVDEAGFIYPDPYCQEPNIRYKPYPNVKERYPPPRYDYSLSSNYPYPFHPNLQSQRYEISKTMPSQPYPGYPHFQYTDSRLSEHMIDRYARPVNAQSNCGLPYSNQLLHHVYGPINKYPQSKLPQYPLDGSSRPISLNKLPYDYENSRLKNYHTLDNYYVNESSKFHALKNQGILPNYAQINVHTVPPNPYYKKDINTKPYEHASVHFSNSTSRNIPQFSTNTLAISPTDSIISNDTTQTHVSALEDCGYSSQSSSTSVRSIDLALNRVPNEYYLRHDYGQLMRPHPGLSKPRLVSNNSESKSKKNLNVRQFLQMWNEGDDEGIEVNSNNEIPTNSKEKAETISNNQEQLYVLGLVNVPSEELGKYEHIQKVSKLPENIKGYSSLELLNQFEEAIGTTQTNSISSQLHFEPPHPVKKPIVPIADLLTRPLSPLDVEAKISQSVIHKEVGCNFEIKPCSPKMLNVEIATPVQSIVRERIIEKIANPHSQMVKSPTINAADESTSIFKPQRQFNTNDKVPSCKMVETQYLNNAESIKNNYSLQDFENNSGVSFASLPRLDNDIEFNFPEVNQQFLNANKGTTRNLPSLDESECNDKTLLNELVINQSTSAFESETLKLSKYRKVKPQTVTVIKNDQLPSPTIRTDSVIIKNPENVKNQNTDFMNIKNKKYLDVDDPADVQMTSYEEQSQISDAIMEVFDHDKPNDIAIDFSLKSDVKDNKILDEAIQEKITHSPITQITKENYTDKYSQLMSGINDLNTTFISGVENNVTCQPEDAHILSEHKETIDEVYNSKSVSNVELKLPDLSENDTNLLHTSHVSENNQNYMKLEKSCSFTGTNKSIEKKETKEQKCAYEELQKSYNFISSYNNVEEGESIGNKIINEVLETSCNSIGNHNKAVKEDSCGKIFVDETLKSNCKPIDIYKNIEEDGIIENKFADEKKEKSCNNIETSNATKERETTDNKYIDEFETSCKHIETHNAIEERGTIANDYTDHELKTSCNLFEINNVIKENGATQDKYTEETSCNLIENHNPIQKRELSEKKYTDHKLETSCNLIETHNPIKEREPSENKYTELETSCNLIETQNPIKKRESSENKCTDQESEMNCNFIETHNDFKEREHSENKYTDYGLETSSNVIETHNATEKRVTTENDYIDHELETSCDLFEINNVINEKGKTENERIDHELETSCNLIETHKAIKEKEITEDKNHEVDASLIKNSNNMDVMSSENTNISEEANLSFNFNTTHRNFEELNKNKNTDDELETDLNLIDNRKTIEKEELHGNKNNDEIKDKLCENEDMSKKSHNCVETCKNIENKLNENEHADPECKPSYEFIERNKNIEEGDSCKNKCIGDMFENNNETIENINEKENIHNNQNDQQFKTMKDTLENENETSQNIESLLISKVNIETADTSHQHCKLNISNACNTLPVTNLHISNSECADSPESYMNVGLDLEFCGNDQLHNLRELNKHTGDHNVSDYFNSSTLVNAPEKMHGFLKHTCEVSVTNFSKLKLYSPRLQKLILYQSGFCKSKHLCTEIQTDFLNDSVSILNPDVSHVDNVDLCAKSNENCIEKDSNLKICDDSTNESTVTLSDAINYSKEHDTISELLDFTTRQELHSSLDIYETNESVVLKQHAIEDSALTENLERGFLNDDSEKFEIGTGPPVLSDDSNSNHSHDETNISDKNIAHELKLSAMDKVTDNDENDDNSNSPIDNTTYQCRDGATTVVETRITLKRSYSDTALDKLKSGLQQQDDSLIWPTKRKKAENTMMPQDLCNILHSTRRNSISSVYNEENVSYCILIDNNCIIADEENLEEKVCYAEFSEVCLTEEINNSTNETIDNTLIYTGRHDSDNSLIFENNEERSPAGSWVEDVACIETVVSDEIAEDVFINEAASPVVDEYFEESSNISHNEHTEHEDYDYGIHTYTDDESLVQTLYSANLIENKPFNIWHSRITQEPAFDRESLEKILSDTQDDVEALVNQHNYDNNNFISDDVHDSEIIRDNKENVDVGNFTPLNSYGVNDSVCRIEQAMNSNALESNQDEVIHSCESSIDSVTYNPLEGDNIYPNSNSPEVSSTTSEEKSSNILLKIKSFKGSKISQVNEFRLESERKSFKYKNNTKKDYLHSSISDVHINRPLITKAAQKYIPPLRESIGDLKVKLVLPQHSLLKLKKMKMSKDVPKPRINNRQTSSVVTNFVKKPKPKFEDVLKSIDEIQFKKHKEKNKKVKKSIPKMIIKKAENGSHYTSTSENNQFNPDLTGRRWQPWVFLEKDQFIDKMALKKKVKAIFNHRKNTYVLAEKFHKYKSVYNTNFVISKPKQTDASKGHLKYTIRLKHD